MSTTRFEKVLGQDSKLRYSKHSLSIKVFIEYDCEEV
jgi:hypothetical protein